MIVLNFWTKMLNKYIGHKKKKIEHWLEIIWKYQLSTLNWRYDLVI